MHILMIAACPFPTPQGTQAYIHELARALSTKHRVDLLTYDLGMGDVPRHDARQPYSIHRAPRIPGHSTTAAGPSWGRVAADVALVAQGLHLLTRQGLRPDLIHAHNYEGAIAGAILQRLTGVPCFYHAHNLMGDELETYCPDHATTARAICRTLGAWLDRHVPAWARGGVSVSQHTLQHLRALGSAPPSMVWLPLGVQDQFQAEARNQKRDIPLIYMGNLDGYQNTPMLARALHHIQERDPTASCAMVSHEDGARFHAHCDALGVQPTVQWINHGDFAHARSWLGRAQVALLPRQVASGFPVKLVNYMLSGRPVVACHGSAHGLTQAQGVLSVPNDPRAFADAALRLLQEEALRKDMGARARQSALALFGEAQSLAVLEKAYRAMIEGPLPVKPQGTDA